MREILKDYGVMWHRPKNFWLDRLPIILDFIFNSPMIVPNTGELKRPRKDGMFQWMGEQISLEGIADFGQYVYKGLIGIGAV